MFNALSSTSIREVIERATSWLKTLTDFGVMLIITFIVLDIIFPQTTGIIGNLTEIIQIATQNEHGIAGLIALLLFLFLLRYRYNK